MVESASLNRMEATALVALAVLAALTVGCATAPTPAPSGRGDAVDRAFLPSPESGYPRSLSAAEAASLRSAHAGLLGRESPAATVEVARVLLEANPALDPARVLWAQAEFVAGRPAEALAAAAAVAERFPDYVAAQLVVGRSAENLNRVETAFETYLRVATRSEAAERRANELRPRAVEIVANRTRDLLAKGRVEEAAESLALLGSWAPDEPDTLMLEADHAAAVGAPILELDAVKRLLELQPSEDLVRRRARLEMEAGDTGEGLRILKELTQRYPGDAELAAELERAKFSWRLELLPADARDLLRLPELTRADFAKLLFWLFPDVRYGRASAGRIASDILDHPYRQEMARVINLDLMWVDSSLHLFYPSRPLTRDEGLEVVLRILARRNPQPACLGSDDPAVRMSVPRRCALAARCGLLIEAGDCLPEAVASGKFVESIGFGALDILGAE